MKFKKLNIHNKACYNIKKIYETSFSENEKIDFAEMFSKNFPHSKLLGIYNNDVIGFSFISLLKNFCYIIYFAIDENKRNCNLGSLALQKLCSLYKTKTKVLCVNKPEAKDKVKLSRIDFYKRNGFKLSNFQFDCSNETYLVMFNGKLDIEKFKKFLLTCFPDCCNFKETE